MLFVILWKQNSSLAFTLFPQHHKHLTRCGRRVVGRFRRWGWSSWFCGLHIVAPPWGWGLSSGVRRTSTGGLSPRPLLRPRVSVCFPVCAFTACVSDLWTSQVLDWRRSGVPLPQQHSTTSTRLFPFFCLFICHADAVFFFCLPPSFPPSFCPSLLFPCCRETSHCDSECTSTAQWVLFEMRFESEHEKERHGTSGLVCPDE